MIKYFDRIFLMNEIVLALSETSDLELFSIRCINKMS